MDDSSAGAPRSGGEEGSPPDHDCSSSPPDCVHTMWLHRGLAVVATTPRGGRAAAVARTPRSSAAAPHALDLDCCGLEELPELQGEDALARLSLRGNRLAHAPALPPSAARTLAALNLSSNRLRDVRAAAALPRLRALLLGRNRLQDLSPLRGLLSLEVLDVSRNRLVSLAGLEALPALAVLRAGHNPLPEVSCLTGLTALTELSLAGCPLVAVAGPLPPPGCEVAASLAGAADLLAPEQQQQQQQQQQALLLPASLERLSLRGCGLPSLAAAAPLRQLPRLRRLTLEGNPLALPARQPPGRAYRAAALAYCCPLGLRALDGEAVAPEERLLLVRAAAAAADVSAAAAAAGSGGGLCVAGQRLPPVPSPAGRLADGPDGGGWDNEAEGQQQAVGEGAAGAAAGAPVAGCGVGGAASVAAASEAAGDQAGSGGSNWGGKGGASPADALSSSSGGGGSGSDGSGSTAAGAGDEEEEEEEEGEMSGGSLAGEWWEAHAQEARGGASSSGGGGRRSGSGSSSSGGDGDGRGARRRAQGSGPAPAGGWWDPISDVELEGTYLLTEGVLLAARGPRRRRAAGRVISPGVEFDGACLSLTGGVLRALRSPAYAAVAEVKLSRVAFDPHIVRALPALEALPHLSRLSLHRNRVATLPQLDCLLRLPRLRALSVTGSPVEALVLLRPYIARRLRQLTSFNGAPVTAREREEGAALFGAADRELAAGLVQPGQRAALVVAGLPGPPEQPPPLSPRPGSGSTADTSRGVAEASAAAASDNRGGAVEAALLAEAARKQQQGGGPNPLPSGHGQGHDDGQQPAPAWLPAVLAHLPAGAAAAAPFVGPSARAGARGARFFDRWAAEAGEVAARLDELDAAWGPAFLEPCAEEGWRGEHTLPGG